MESDEKNTPAECGGAKWKEKKHPGFSKVRCRQECLREGGLAERLRCANEVKSSKNRGK